MRRFGLFALAALAALATLADGPLGADRSGTNRVVVSKTITSKAWKRDVVTVDQLGQIHNDSGRIAQTAETSAINEVAENAAGISDAATASMNSAMDFLLTKTNDMAQAGLGIAIAFPPETSDPNVRGFVVLTEYDSATGEDIQWVHYNRELSLSPNRTVVYETYGESVRVKCIWDKWDAAGTNLTVSGRVWQGCHKCRVPRPAFARGKSCLDIPNETWGSENGMEWGDMTLTDANGRNYYTGFVTNSVTHEVAYFDNGFLKEIKTEN